MRHTVRRVREDSLLLACASGVCSLMLITIKQPDSCGVSTDVGIRSAACNYVSLDSSQYVTGRGACRWFLGQRLPKSLFMAARCRACPECAADTARGQSLARNAGVLFQS